MKKRFLLTFCCMILFLSAGCTSSHSLAAENRSNLFLICLGMKRQAVLDLMGTGCNVVYSSKPSTVKSFDPLIHDTYLAFRGKFFNISNPNRSEYLYAKGRKFFVDYFVTKEVQEGLEVIDGDTMPVVYENDLVVGWGWAFFDGLLGQ